MNKLQQECEEWEEAWKLYLSLTSVDDWHITDTSRIWKEMYKKQSLPYIDLLKDIYYNYDLPDGVDQKIEELLGDLL